MLTGPLNSTSQTGKNKEKQNKFSVRRKHAYSNTLNFFLSKNEQFYMKN